MSLAELMPAVRSLSRNEQVELKRFLDSELSDHAVSDAYTVDPELESDLLRQLAAAAPFQRDPVEVTPEGMIALEQVRAEARSKNV